MGLVSGVYVADFGHDVICVDNDQTKIDPLRAGQIPIFEPGLEECVGRNVAEGHQRFSTDLDTAIVDIDVVFIAVSTPSCRGDGHADLTYMYAAARAIKGFTVVVTKSTVPVGTGAGPHRSAQHLPP
jgi:UDPglucose 6-dehydrogenase